MLNQRQGERETVPDDGRSKLKSNIMPTKFLTHECYIHILISISYIRSTIYFDLLEAIMF